LAYSSDGGQSWTKYANNPVLEHIRGGNRDPKVVWYAPGPYWVMALYLDQNDFALLKSADLKTWEKVQDLTVPGTDECPDFYEMPIEGEAGKTAWIWTAANAKYLVGSFDGKHFEPEGGFKPLQSEFNREFYAGQTFSNTTDGRRIQIAWLRDGKYPEMPFNQQLTFPTQLTLHRTREGLRLHRMPIEEIATLRDKKVTRAKSLLLNSSEELHELNSDLLDLNVTIDVGTAHRVGLRVRGQAIVFGVAKKTLESLNATAPLSPVDGKITLRVLVDRTSIEVFANNGAVSLSGCYLPNRNSSEHPPAIFSEGGTATLLSCEAYTLKSAWTDAWRQGLEEDK
jgi:sucrose-6-phosphate hydrolase SacC (GH32 family)